MDKVKTAYDKRELQKLGKNVDKYRSLQNEHTLYVNQEEKWYYMTLERVKEMKEKSTVEILQELLLNVQYHPKIKRRMKKQIKKLSKEICNKTIGNCLYELMQSYISKEGNANQASRLTKTEEHQNSNEVVVVSNELKNEPKTDAVQLNETQHPAKKKQVLPMLKEAKVGTIFESLQTSEGNPKTLGKIRCRCCRRRGHFERDCPVRKKCRNWLREASCGESDTP